MISLLRRKPKSPLTPARRYETDLNLLVLVGLLAGLVAGVLAYVLRTVGDEWRQYSSLDFIVAALLIGLVLSTLPFIRKMYFRTRAQLMEHAPVDEAAAAEASAITLLDTGQVRYSDVLETDLPSFVHIYEAVRRPRLYFASMAFVAAIAGIALFVSTLIALFLVLTVGVEDAPWKHPGSWMVLGVFGAIALLTIFVGYRMFRYLRGCVWARPARAIGRTQAIMNIDTDQNTADLLGITERSIEGGGWHVSEGLRVGTCRGWQNPDDPDIRGCGRESGGPDECAAASVSRETEA